MTRELIKLLKVGKKTIFRCHIFKRQFAKNKFPHCPISILNSVKSASIHPDTPLATAGDRHGNASGLGRHFHCCYPRDAEPLLLCQTALNELWGTDEKILGTATLLKQLCVKERTCQTECEPFPGNTPARYVGCFMSHSTGPSFCTNTGSAHGVNRWIVPTRHGAVNRFMHWASVCANLAQLNVTLGNDIAPEK